MKGDRTWETEEASTADATNPLQPKKPPKKNRRKNLLKAVKNNGLRKKRDLHQTKQDYRTIPKEEEESEAEVYHERPEEKDAEFPESVCRSG